MFAPEAGGLFFLSYHNNVSLCQVVPVAVWYDRRMTISKHVKDKAIEAYREGMHTVEVAALCGISRQVLDKWRREGADGTGPHAAFAREAAAAEAEHVRDTIRILNGSRASDPNLALKLLQADPKTRDRYGARVPEDTGGLAGLGALYAALTSVVSTEPARLGAAEPLPLLEEVREVREVEEEAGSNGSRQQQEQ